MNVDVRPWVGYKDRAERDDTGNGTRSPLAPLRGEEDMVTVDQFKRPEKASGAPVGCSRPCSAFLGLLTAARTVMEADGTMPGWVATQLSRAVQAADAAHEHDEKQADS